MMRKRLAILLTALFVFVFTAGCDFTLLSIKTGEAKPKPVVYHDLYAENLQRIENNVIGTDIVAFAVIVYCVVRGIWKEKKLNFWFSFIVSCILLSIPTYFLNTTTDMGLKNLLGIVVLFWAMLLLLLLLPGKPEQESYTRY